MSTIDRRTLLGAAALACVVAFTGCAPNSGRAETTSLKGNVLYRERMALPPGAIVEVKLLDVSLADAPSVTIAEQQVTGAVGSPIPFALSFDRSQLRPGRTYALSARISADGRLLFVSATRNTVFGGGPDNTDILVERIASNAQQPDSPIGTWLAEDIQGGGVIDNLQSTLSIAADGAVSGKGGCNRLIGHAKINGNQITFGQIGSTRMLCPPAVMDQESKFLAALEKVRRFKLQTAERKLLLLDAKGKTILRLARQS